MSTNAPNASVSQTAGGTRAGCGGATCTMNLLNGIGKWGTALTGVLTGRSVSASGAVGAKPAVATSSASMLVIVLVIGAILFVMLRK